MIVTTGGVYGKSIDPVPTNTSTNFSNDIIDSIGSSNNQGITGQLMAIQKEINEQNLVNAREVNEFNAKEAQKNREWQEKMYGQRYQMTVKDMIAAGINPVLAAMNNPGSVGSGSTASGQKANFESGIGAIASIITASINAATSMQIAQLNASNNLDIAKMNNQVKYDTDPTAAIMQYLQNGKNSSIGKVISNYSDDFKKGIYYTFHPKEYISDLKKYFK